MNSRQQAFARHIAEGKTNSEAYRLAYPRSQNWTSKAVRTRAARLMENAGVKRAVEELRRESDAESVMELRELRRRVTAKLRAVDDGGGSVTDFCRLAETLARVSGWLTPSALAVAVTGVTLTPEDKGRRICELLGVSLNEVRRRGHDEAWNLFQDALGIPQISQEERARRINAILGIPEEEDGGVP